MMTYDNTPDPHDDKTTDSSWFTKPGPTESFLKSAPPHVLRDNRESAPPVKSDPSWFTTVGPTPGFVYSR